jgi:hypothetical protein
LPLFRLEASIVTTLTIIIVNRSSGSDKQTVETSSLQPRSRLAPFPVLAIIYIHIEPSSQRALSPRRYKQLKVPIDPPKTPNNVLTSVPEDLSRILTSPHPIPYPSLPHIPNKLICLLNGLAVLLSPSLP